MSRLSDDPITEADLASLFSSFSATITTYERRIGRATHAVATHIPSLLPPLPSTHPLILDTACGTGAVTTELLKAYPGARVHAVDAAPGMVEIMQAMVRGKPEWRFNIVDVAVMDGHELRFANDIFDISVMNFGIFFFADPTRGASEIYRTLKPGGVAVVSCWKELGFLPILWEVQRRIGPIEPLLGLPLLDRWMDGVMLEGVMREGGFEDVRMECVHEVLWGKDMQDLEVCLGENFKALTGSQWSETERGKLDEVTRVVLEDEGSRFCARSERQVGVRMVAWVAVCTKATG